MYSFSDAHACRLDEWKTKSWDLWPKFYHSAMRCGASGVCNKCSHSLFGPFDAQNHVIINLFTDNKLVGCTAMAPKNSCAIIINIYSSDTDIEVYRIIYVHFETPINYSAANWNYRIMIASSASGDEMIS